MNYRKQHLAGITIIEVLFSVGIIVTGLLGVAGLIMIAGSQMTQGLEADAMSNAGLNAIAEFDTRKMRRIAEHDTYKMGRSDSLLWYNTNTNSFTPVLLSDLYGAVPTDVFPGADGDWGRSGVDDDGNTTRDDISEAGWKNSDDYYQPCNTEPSPSFCIDPFFIAQQIADRNLNIYESNRFPGIRADLANPNWIAPWQMRRVTLTRPAHTTDANGNNVYLGPNLPLSLLQSREIFTIKDDLVFNIPTAATELPQQSWITDQATANAISPRQTNGIDDDQDGVVDEFDEAYVKRLNAAETSWMATLTPNRNRMNVAAWRLEPTDQYLLSIVVFNNRFINYTDPNTAEEKERLLNITFLNEGFGGGEVRLSHTNSAALELKHGDWVMLSADSKIGSCFRWYRISYIEDETPRGQINADGEYYRFATLQGPDWSRPEWHPARVPAIEYRETYVTYIPGVVGVFEKTIRIESTSLY
jgi:hypothetical protein